MPLEQAVAMTRLDTMVPAIVQRCIDYLDQNGELESIRERDFILTDTTE